MSEPERTLFEAAMEGSRSMGRRGVKIVAGFLIGVSAATSTMFWILGAWPVAGFAGGEIALAVWLLARNAANAGGRETLRLTDRRLFLIRTDRHGRERRAEWPPAWLRVELHEREGRAPALYLTSHGRREEIASSLGAAAKRDLARAVRQALATWPDDIRPA